MNNRLEIRFREKAPNQVPHRPGDERRAAAAVAPRRRDASCDTLQCVLPLDVPNVRRSLRRIAATLTVLVLLCLVLAAFVWWRLFQGALSRW